MVQPIMKDPIFLAQPSEKATAEDMQTARDLIETLLAHRDECVGMAANMIGVKKRIIAINHDGRYMVLINPKIIRHSGSYETEEGCLSLSGTRKTTRWSSITVQYWDMDFKPMLKTFRDLSAQIIQHEIDHCDGVLI